MTRAMGGREFVTRRQGRVSREELNSSAFPYGTFDGGYGWTRTTDPGIMSAVL